MHIRPLKRVFLILTATLMLALALAGCGSSEGEVQIIRIGHNQSQTHPTHLALLEFEKYVESKAGDRYDLVVYPSELLGSQTDMVQLTQTGAINFCVASNAILETFSQDYEIFNLPYLFASSTAYHHVMDDPSVTDEIFNSTSKAGFTGVTWLDAGTRNFYTIKKPIHTPADLKGLKIRVQQSPSNIKMMDLLGGSATPMGFGEVYTSLQSGIIDGAENNELALTNNGHGEVCKYYSYDMHQMVPDIVIGNTAFLEELSEEDRAIFEEGFQVISQVERREWAHAVEEAKDRAENEMGVEFIYPDTAPFQEACISLHETVLDENPGLRSIYDKVMEYNELYPTDDLEVSK